MNFKLLILISFIFSSCGVKGPPRPPAGTAVPSYLDSYLKKNGQPLTEISDAEEKSPSESKKKVTK